MFNSFILRCYYKTACLYKRKPVLSWNQTLDQHFDANLKNVFLVNFAANFSRFPIFAFWHKCWSKYATSISLLICINFLDSRSFYLYFFKLLLMSFLVDFYTKHFQGFPTTAPRPQVQNLSFLFYIVLRSFLAMYQPQAM